MFGQIKDSIIYKWNEKERTRFCIKALTCPCLWCLYCARWSTTTRSSGCVKKRPKRPNKRELKMSEINKNRRTRQLKTRKRSVSVDGRRKSSKANEQQQSSFFSTLPPEIRLKIYEMVYCNEDELKIVTIHPQYSDWYNIWATKRCSTNLLRTCKRLYREAVRTLYSGNNFSFGSIKTLKLFLQLIPGQRLQQIRSISLRDVDFDMDALLSSDYRPVCTWHKTPDFLNMLHSMHGLRNLTLHYVISSSDYERYLRDRTFRVFDEIPTRFLHTACRVEYKVEEPSESMIGAGTEQIWNILSHNALEMWWVRGYL